MMNSDEPGEVIAAIVEKVVAMQEAHGQPVTPDERGWLEGVVRVLYQQARQKVVQHLIARASEWVSDADEIRQLKECVAGEGAKAPMSANLIVGLYMALPSAARKLLLAGAVNGASPHEDQTP